MAKRKMRTVRYRVTGDFGDSSKGDIRKAIVLLEESNGGSALIYHPRTRGLCASLEMAHEVDGVYVSSCEDERFGWVNVSSQKDLDELVVNLESNSYTLARARAGEKEDSANG